MFDINLGLSIWTIAVFVLLLFILKKFAWGPILGAVQDREDRLRSTLESAASEREESTKLLEQYRKQMLEARREAQDLIVKAKEAGAEVRKEIEEDARAEANVIMEKARESIEKEKSSIDNKVLKKFSGMVRSKLSKTMQIRRVPIIQFRFDESIEYSDNIENLLKNL